MNMNIYFNISIELYLIFVQYGTRNTTIQIFGVSKINFLDLSQHLFDQKYSKKSNIVE